MASNVHAHFPLATAVLVVVVVINVAIITTGIHPTPYRLLVN
jgi:hypothetical protein